MATKRLTSRRARRRPVVKFLKLTAMSGTAAVLLVVIGGLAVYLPIMQEAKDDAGHIEKLLTVQDVNPSVILSADGVILYSVAAIRRKVVDLTDPKYPSYVRYAIVAAEDRRFYDHKGVDPMGLARAVVRHGEAGGGSTIPMQLAKNLVNGNDRSLRRKLKDIATAQEIEELKSKDDILNLYANSSYFGENAYGIERAAQVYFGKHAEKLTVGEAAMLARCVRTPSRVNPFKTPQKMLDYRDFVLGVMRDEGWITQGQYDEGVKEAPPKPRPDRVQGVRTIRPDAAYFVQHVRSQLQSDLGIDLNAGGYTVRTTLNYKLQRRAVQAVAKTLSEFRGDRVNDGAVVVMDGEGRILAEVGGPKGREFNVVTQGKRQPGSAFKAIVYATQLKNGVIHPGDDLSNAPIHLQVGRRKYWNPGNASRRENRPTYSLQEAFAYSVNRPAIWTIMKPDRKAGPRNVVAAAHDVFGIKSELPAVPSLALGVGEVRPLEMLEAYSVFMLGGDRARPMPVVRIIDPAGEDAHPYAPYVKKGALNKDVAREMDEVMRGPVWMPRATATYAQVVPNARGKTGTTNDHRDAWFCGYSDGLVGVAWTGNTAKNGDQLRMGESVFGGTVSVRIWSDVMLAAHELGLAKGVGGTVPGTTTAASEAPDEEPRVVPAHDPDEDDAPRHDPGAAAPETDGPVIVDPAPQAPEASPTPDETPKTDPPATDPPKTDPPARTVDPVDPVAPPADERPRRADRRRHEAKRAEEDTVEVMVCVDSGMKANAYCPETVTRRFPRNRAPRKYCTIHHE